MKSEGIMSNNPKKRTIDAFFAPSTSKKPKLGSDSSIPNASNDTKHPPKFSTHSAYPHPIRELPPSLSEAIEKSGSNPGKVINDQPHLDLLYYQPYIPRNVAREFFGFLRQELPFYRVEYSIKRGGVETQIKTPRYTTVFGIDSTSHFTPTGEIHPPPPSTRPYPIPPRPIPACLLPLLQSTTLTTSQTYNFCLVNYYSSNSDSISYHSDDESFLGKDPAIASFSLGEKRDFLMKHKPGEVGKGVKLSLGSGDMVLMKGETQKNWLHSIPKRSVKGEGGGGRINITFRKAVVRAGTENYYRYNVGTGPVYRWDDSVGEMKLWKGEETV